MPTESDGGSSTNDGPLLNRDGRKPGNPFDARRFVHAPLKRRCRCRCPMSPHGARVRSHPASYWEPRSLAITRLIIRLVTSAGGFFSPPYAAAAAASRTRSRWRRRRQQQQQQLLQRTIQTNTNSSIIMPVLDSPSPWISVTHTVYLHAYILYIVTLRTAGRITC